MSPTRREFLAGGAGVLAAGALAAKSGKLLDGVASAQAERPRPQPWLPRPQDSGIDHIIVVMMENRSFDHYLGWVPGADGRQAGLHYRDAKGIRHTTHHLKDFQNCDHPDPDHSYDGGRIQLNDGKCDGWLLTRPNELVDTFPIGYYTDADLGFFGKAAPYWTTFDRYFAATMAETMPNRFYMHAAQTDRKKTEVRIAQMPTIWDRLAQAGVSRRYYYSDVPYIALLGVRHLPISVPFELFLADCALGTLPSVSFVEPHLLGLGGDGTAGSDHPHGDIRTGQHFLNHVYKAVTNGPKWDRTALIFNYDEWGGFYDHVRPGVAPDAHADQGLGQRGFRVPAMLVSPRARRHHVAHETYDHTSILKMIEWRFGLKPLTPRDRAARNIAEAMDFHRRPNLKAPQWEVPIHVPLPCWLPHDPAAPQTGAAPQTKAMPRPSAFEELSDILDLAARSGFEIPST